MLVMPKNFGMDFKLCGVLMYDRSRHILTGIEMTYIRLE